MILPPLVFLGQSHMEIFGGNVLIYFFDKLDHFMIVKIVFHRSLNWLF
jgi:hypothetical protein